MALLWEGFVPGVFLRSLLTQISPAWGELGGGTWNNIALFPGVGIKAAARERPKFMFLSCLFDKNMNPSVLLLKGLSWQTG